MMVMALKLRNSVSAPALQTELSVLGATIRAELAAVARSASEMLTHAIAVGEALNKVKKLVGHGNWVPWVSTEYGLSLRSAQDYMRLANHREVLEANTQHAAPASIRAALRRIGTGVNMRKRRPVSELRVASWKAADSAVREVFIAGIPLTELLAAMPASYRTEIVDRVDGLRAALAKPVVTKPATQPTTKPTTIEIRRAA